MDYRVAQKNVLCKCSILNAVFQKQYKKSLFVGQHYFLQQHLSLFFRLNKSSFLLCIMTWLINNVLSKYNALIMSYKCFNIKIAVVMYMSQIKSKYISCNTDIKQNSPLYNCHYHICIKLAALKYDIHMSISSEAICGRN